MNWRQTNREEEVSQSPLPGRRGSCKQIRTLASCCILRSLLSTARMWAKISLRPSDGGGGAERKCTKAARSPWSGLFRTSCAARPRLTCDRPMERERERDTASKQVKKTKRPVLAGDTGSRKMSKGEAGPHPNIQFPSRRPFRAASASPGCFAGPRVKRCFVHQSSLQ